MSNSISDSLPGLLVDIFDDYQYLFFLCGAVIVSGGIFLFVMNLYNYRRLENERAGGQPTPNRAVGQDRPDVQNALDLGFCAKDSAVPESGDGGGEPAMGAKTQSIPPQIRVSNLHLPDAPQENGGSSPPPNYF